MYVCARSQVSYSANSRLDETPTELTVTSAVLDVVLCDLDAGVEYHIRVAAATSKGYGAVAAITTWTEIGTPEKPPKPRVNATGPGTITILIQPAVLTRGPISAYFIVISTPNNNGTVGRRKRAAARVRRALPDPVQHIGLPGVTVAQLAADDVKLARYFVVGDGQVYGGYENPPLTANILYTIYYVVASSLDGQTKMNFASTDRPVAPSSGALAASTSTTQQTLGEELLSRDAIIAIAVVVSLLLLLLLIAAVLTIYYCYCKQRPRRPASSPRPTGSPLNASWLKYYTGNHRVLLHREGKARNYNGFL